MTLLVVEQALNGLQFGLTLFLMTAGLTLTFGVMRVINLAHGSLYMAGAYVAAYISVASGSFALGIVAALAVSAVLGMLLETGVFRALYQRDHLEQVLATFALILLFNGCVGLVFGRRPFQIEVPALFSGAVAFGPDFAYPKYRLALIGLGLAVAALLHFLIARTRFGMLVRAGSTHRDMVRALGVDLPLLYTLVFAFGAALAGLAGAAIGPIQAVEVGMGDHIIVLAFVVIVIGGIGSVKGALTASLLVGLVETFGRTVVPPLLKTLVSTTVASSIGAAISATSVYVLMALVLLIRPSGLFAPRSR